MTILDRMSTLALLLALAGCGDEGAGGSASGGGGAASSASSPAVGPGPVVGSSAMSVASPASSGSGGDGGGSTGAGGSGGGLTGGGGLGGGAPVGCTDVEAFCEGKLAREDECGNPSRSFAQCLDAEECVFREGEACEYRSCVSSAPCGVDCAGQLSGSDFSEAGSSFLDACAPLAGCEDLPAGSCEEHAHLSSDELLAELLDCVVGSWPCASAGACLDSVAREWQENPVGCGPIGPFDERVCAAGDDAFCAAAVERNVECNVQFGSETVDACLANLDDFHANYRDEVQCDLDACFAGAPCDFDCRLLTLRTPPSAVGATFLDACLPRATCRDFESGSCILFAQVWEDVDLESAMACFEDAGAPCEQVASCVFGAHPNDWSP